MMEKCRADGLLCASAIVDWPLGERDGYNDGVVDPEMPKQVGPKVNTVANAFYYHALGRMALLARALDRQADARNWDEKANQVRDSFNRVFFDPSRGLFLDGEASSHCSLHANLFPLAFGLAVEERVPKIADFLESRGMACSVYGAQYLLEALFAAGREEYAIGLMSARTPRSWWHMIDSGSTMTWEAWGPQFKPNLTWNHAWGAAPANILSRFVLGVRPIEPGYSKILIAPQPGSLEWVQGKVPTPLGPVTLRVENGTRFKIQLQLPPNSSARLILPRRKAGEFLLDGKLLASPDRGSLSLEIPSGMHRAESR